MATTKSTTHITNPSMTTKAKPFQVLVRLPEDVASRFVQVVKPGQRNSYFLELLRRDLDRESNELAEAAKTLTALEANDHALRMEDDAWLNAPLSDITLGDEDFDMAEFERQFHIAQQERKATSSANTQATKPAKRGQATHKTRSRKSLQTA